MGFNHRAILGQEKSKTKYIGLSYIQNISPINIYVDTGVCLSTNYTIDFTIYTYSAQHSGSRYFFGVSKGNTSSSGQFYVWRETRYNDVCYNNTAHIAYDNSTQPQGQYRFIYTLNGSSYTTKMYGTTKTGTASGSARITRPLYIFALNMNNKGYDSEQMRFYYGLITDSNVVVRNFKCAYRSTDNWLGLFDTINKRFHPIVGNSNLLSRGSVDGNIYYGEDYTG